MIVWVNLHGGFLIGPAFTLLFAAEAVYSANSFQTARVVGFRWGAFLGASLLAALISPHGVAGLLFPIQLIRMTSALAPIGEWQPSSLANNGPLIIWLLLFLFVVMFFQLRVGITRILMLLILIYLAFAHLRHTELMALAVPLLLQDALTENPFKRCWVKMFGWAERIWPVAVPVAMIFSVTLAVSCLAAASRSRSHDADKFTPEAAVNWSQSRQLCGQVLNSYNFGGYLIFRGIAPFIDGRLELYGEAFVDRYFTLENLPSLLDEYHITWTIFEPSNPRNILLDQMPGWHRVYADDQAQIHVRDP